MHVSLFLLAFVLSTAIRADSHFDVLEHIDPLIGSTNGGNVFAGATLPYGMAKAVADVDGQNTGGFSTDGSNITGSSSMHDSGTGGNPSLGNFPIFPQLCEDDVLDNCVFQKANRATHYVNDSVVAKPGYFEVLLVNGINAKMTTTQHASLYEFSFSRRKTKEGRAINPLVQLDLTDLWVSRQNASISVDPHTGQMKGNGTFLPSFGAGSYMLHFCVDFAGAMVKDSGIWVNSRAGTSVHQLYVTRGFNLWFTEAGGFVRFNRPANGTISVRTGISFISADQACKHASAELPSWNFNDTRQAAEQAWREKLRPISIDATGTSAELQRSFWSGLYRTMMSPQNYTGENYRWQSPEYWDSFYCIWDQFRSQLPMLTIIDPHSLSSMLRSLLYTYQREGWLPDCRMSLCQGWTQGGSNADNVLVDAYIKNVTGVDWGLAYEAVVNDAESEPLEWQHEGRGGLTSWKTKLYIPYLDFDYLGFGTDSRSVSRTLEYAYNDFNIATLGKGLGKPNFGKYLSRAMNWRHLFKPDQTSYINGTNTSFTGFFQPKYLNGTWGFQDPVACSILGEPQFCSLTTNPSETFESTVWEYTFFVPHDFSTLISLMGGDTQFVKRLDYFHETPGLADISNEPVFLTVYAYHYAGRPGKSAERVHYYIPSSFNDTLSGLPGNDDSGAMGSFTAFSMMGIFPNPGQNVYLITAPFFKSWSVKSPATGKTATVKVVEGFDVGYKNIYIQSAKVNGRQWTKNWITHELFSQGWTLELVLGPEESDWGTAVKDRPPSMGNVSGSYGPL